MGSRAVRNAMVKASSSNLQTLMAMTGDTYWLTVPTTDVRDVLCELRRLQRIESALLSAIDLKMERVEVERLAGNQAEWECQIEEKIERRVEERRLRDDAYTLSRIANGEEIG